MYKFINTDVLPSPQSSLVVAEAMADYIKSLIGDNEVVSFKLGSLFQFEITDKHNAFDGSNVIIYLNPWDEAGSIRQALANKNLISFDEV